MEKPIEWLIPEEDLQQIYSQKPEKVNRIVKSLEKYGYDKSNDEREREYYLMKMFEYLKVFLLMEISGMGKEMNLMKMVY